jgi:hypothetical protein
MKKSLRMVADPAKVATVTGPLIAAALAEANKPKEEE